MNCGDIERTLAGIQARNPGERLPLERVLNALREDEYGDHLFMRDYGDDIPSSILQHFGYYRRK